MSQDAIKLEGGKKLTNLTGELPKRVRAKGMRQGVTAAAAPTVKLTKSKTPRLSNLLKKSITRKVKTYRGGDVATAIIGSNRNVEGEWRGKKRVPANYFHLVESGHDDVAGRHMLGESYDATKDEAGGIMLRKYQSVLETEAAKLAAA